MLFLTIFMDSNLYFNITRYLDIKLFALCNIFLAYIYNTFTLYICKKILYHTTLYLSTTLDYIEQKVANPYIYITIKMGFSFNNSLNFLLH